MQNETIPLEIINDLQTANKYIFVQDFVRAEEILKSISQKHENEYEIYFRRVEIATKNSKLEELLLDLSEQEKLTPDSDAVKLAYLLAKIKKHTIDKNKTTNKELFNKNIDIFFSNYEKVVRLPNKKLKLHRSVNIPDDSIQTSDSDNFKVDQNFDNSYFDELIQKIFDYYKKNPENYAACYVAGCVLDNLGNLEEAIHKWKKALNLNPHSICTLSILAELQQKGHFHEQTDDFCLKLESLDKYLVHGHIETHTDLYNDFITRGDYRNAISSLKILSDWIFCQYGSIPIEIEVICLLGSMNAYKLDNNTVASESCKNEVENIIITYKKTTPDLNHLVFIAELCEEYELKQLSKICYFSILTSKNADIQIVKEVASHCVNHYASEALLINLKNAYENSKGNPEIRFCMILCSLHLKEINIVNYMEVKNKIRELISQNHIDEAFPFLEELTLKFSDDPETHYYLAEIYSRKGLISQAQNHFQVMVNLDSYNSDAIVKYIYFLLRNKLYLNAINISTNIVKFDILSTTQTNEIRWSLSAAYFAEEKYEFAKQEISKSINNEPWNISYISLNLRCCLHLTDDSTIPDAFFMIAKIEEFTLEHEKIPTDKKEKLIQNLVDYSLFCLRKGFFEIAWSFAKVSLIVSKKLDARISDALSKTAAAFLPHTTIAQILVLLKKQSEIDMSFSEITGCIAKTYGLTGQWGLVDEWLSMAQNQPFTDKISQSKLFELEALSMAMQGADLKKAQNLLEAAIDCYETHEQVPFETKILHGYILVAQGNIAVGIEKMQSHINENPSIQSLYFFIKGLERAGILSSISKESIEQMHSAYPLNNFEQKMMEEIFYTVSSKIDVIPLGLAC